ncbi:response regulator [Rhizobium leguminosarum]|uniref:response regulator n=1 Tax=Rhizobium leguminosarum TaxID=384 RepID=UPI001C98B96F|nr:response regulator [Rhizobium leguminosarum]MBY5774860.1 response regulator [Rhizobium leguminosarum]
MTDVDRKPTILFVDDESRIGRLLRMMFRTDYDVHIALGAYDALAILEKVTVDVIITDQRMPEMTGVQLLSQVRARWPETVRLLLTGYSDLVAIIAAVNEGEVHQFLNKPWNHDELRDAVSEAAERAESLRATRRHIGSAWTGDKEGQHFSITSQVLIMDANEDDRRQVREFLTGDYLVTEASSIEESIDRIATEQVGVVVGSIELRSAHVVALFEEVYQIDPAVTTVAMTSEPHGDAIVQLINNGRIFRFAIKPLSFNLFRSAVGNAMREHHRRLADPRIIRRRMHSDICASRIRQRLLDQLQITDRP